MVLLGGRANLCGCVDIGMAVDEFRHDVDVAFLRSKVERVQSVL